MPVESRASGLGEQPGDNFRAADISPVPVNPMEEPQQMRPRRKERKKYVRDSHVKERRDDDD